MRFGCFWTYDLQLCTSFFFELKQKSQTVLDCKMMISFCSTLIILRKGKLLKACFLTSACYELSTVGLFPRVRKTLTAEATSGSKFLFDVLTNFAPVLICLLRFSLTTATSL